MNPDASSDRVRPHPQERFAAPAQRFDLEAAAAQLAREATAAHGGHRQKTLFRHGNTSLALFVFQPGGELREHRADGTVFIQVLRGRLIVTAADQRHDLAAGQVLVMAPGVPHALHADELAHMLLTVALE
jgi:quercetin dioxygenase-like cupin family protein